MGIRLKVFFILGVTLLFLILVIYTISNGIIGNSIKGQEEQSTQEKVNDVLRTLSFEYSALNSISGDWAQWDDTYNFIKKQNEDYIVSNFGGNSTLSSLKLDAMIFVNSQGRIIYSKGYDAKNGVETEIPDDLKEQIGPGKKILRHSDAMSIISGIILLKKGPMLLFSRPITTTDTKAPINGTFIIGRCLDKEMLNNFEELTNLHITLERIDGIPPGSEFQTALSKISSGLSIFVSPLNKDTVAGYTTVKDLYGDAKLIMEVAAPRRIYKQGENALKLLLTVLVISSLVIFTVCILLVHGLITSRLERLHLFIKKTGIGKNTSGYIEMKGSDEISKLANTTNSMLSDINKIYKELKESEERLKLVLEGANDGFWDWNITTGDIFFSQNCLELLGYKTDEIEGNLEQWKKLLHPDEYDYVMSDLDKNIKGFSKFSEIEHRMLTKEDGWKWFLTKGKVVEQDVAGNPIRMAGTVSDISERKKSEEEIKFLSFHDKLTGLNNRAYFEREIERINSSGYLPFAIIMGDLNGLKMANDAFGHGEGDKLLCKIAEVLKKSCNKGDIIARWGGDEFAIILRNANEENSAKICERIKLNCNKIKGCMVKPSIALGLAVKSDLSQKGEELLKDAEERMYRNKLLENKSVRSSIINSLEQALAERSYETEEHTKRIREMCIKMGHSIGLKNGELDQLVLLATLHDIGKIAIPDNILLKPGSLDQEEWKIMKSHSEIGYRIAMSSPELVHIATSILAHHERYDGTGYPSGLKGEEIPVLSRILAIVDAFDVMTHKRPYKGGISKELAVEEIKRCAGSQFDPDLVDIFLKLNDLLVVY